MPKQNAQSAEVLTTAGPTEVRLRGRHGPESEPRFEEFRTERGTNPFRSDLIVLSGALLLLPLFFGGNQTEAQLILVLVALGGAFLSLAGKRGTQYRAFAQSSATHSVRRDRLFFVVSVQLRFAYCKP